MYKQLCNTHKQAIIGFADDIPICSICETDQYWVLQSYQQMSFDLYEAQQQKLQISKFLTLKARRKLLNLTQSFEKIQNHFTNQLNELISMHLKQSFNILVAEEIIKNIELIENILGKYQQQVINKNASKMVNIFVPKQSKLIQLETKKDQQYNALENKSHAKQVQVQVQEQLNEDVNKKQEQLIEYHHQGKDNLGLDNVLKEELIKKLKKLRYRNIYVSEYDFYKSIETHEVEQTLYDEIMSKKLSIELAPEEVQNYITNQLQKMNRETNFCESTIDYAIFIRGYTQNYLLNGRGIVYSKWYYENGYYINGLLVWGQIISVQNDIINHQEIVNDDPIELIKQIAGYPMMWNECHYQRTQNFLNF